MRPPIRSHRVRTPSVCGPGLWSPGAQPGLDRGDLRVLPGSWADPFVCMPWALTPRGTLDAKPVRRRGDSLPLVPRRRLPELDLSRLVTTAYTLAVYASPRRVTPALRKTRFRWVASPCRVGFGPTGSTTKGFRFCLLHVPSSLPRLDLARGPSFPSGSRARNREDGIPELKRGPSDRPTAAGRCRRPRTASRAGVLTKTGAPERRLAMSQPTDGSDREGAAP